MKPSPVPANATVGIVLATHAALPYIHLHLECLRKHEPGVKVLIHDDFSPKQNELRVLAQDYGADFFTTDYRRADTVGDLSAFAEGLKWGDRTGLDVVVKCSRRFIIDRPWSDGLVQLLHNTGQVTACAPCAHFNFGFRSELVGMHVRSWIDSCIMAEMASFVAENQPYGFPEAYHHNKSREVHRFAHPIGDSMYGDSSNPNCDFTIRSEQFFPRPGNYDGYAWWPLMGIARTEAIPNQYWHDQAQPPDYARLAMAYGLPYRPEDFTLEYRQ